MYFDGIHRTHMNMSHKYKQCLYKIFTSRDAFIHKSFTNSFKCWFTFKCKIRFKFFISLKLLLDSFDSFSIQSQICFLCDFRRVHLWINYSLARCTHICQNNYLIKFEFHFEFLLRAFRHSNVIRFFLLLITFKVMNVTGELQGNAYIHKCLPCFFNCELWY